MRIVVKKERVELVLSMRQKAQLLGNGKWRTEAARGVGDAGRKTKTAVQRAAYQQMGLKQGKYQSNVSSQTRGVLRSQALSYDIFGVQGGQDIEDYKGLRVLKSGGAAATRGNTGRSAGSEGTVRSNVWNISRVFKRSFASTKDGRTFAVLPGKGGRAPKALWTFGSKPSQPRGPNGRFAKSGITYGKIRKLKGASLRKEIPKDRSLATFHRVGSAELKDKVGKRMKKFLKL